MDEFKEAVVTAMVQSKFFNPQCHDIACISEEAWERYHQLIIWCNQGLDCSAGWYWTIKSNMHAMGVDVDTSDILARIRYSVRQ